MTEKKKLSVAEILAAARKQGQQGAGGAAPAESPPAAEGPVAETTPSAEPASTESPPAKAVAKPVASGERPNVKDILAMARGGAGKGATPATEAAKPAAEKPRPAAPKAAADKPAAKPAAEKAAPVAAGTKDTASILAAARKGTKPGPITKSEAEAKASPAAEPKPAKGTVPPMPAKPAYAEKKPGKGAAAAPTRRGFFDLVLGSFLGLGFTSLSLTSALWTLGTARFLFPNILTEPPSKFKVGFPGDFAPGSVSTKFVAQFGVWVVNGEYQGQSMIFALKTVCTHLGCTPNWLEAEQKFKCPCHGSGFYKDGINFEGPAPRPLERHAIRLADDGQIEIDKSKTFQEEMGQWANPATFIPV